MERPQSLGIKAISFDFRQHPYRDGGARSSGAQMLALEKNRFAHALLVLDHEGSGSSQSPEDLEASLDAQLSKDWDERAKSIVIAPELEAWMWGSDNVLAQVLRWPRREPIRQWLTSQGFAQQPDGKPARPKEALEAIFPICRLPRSASNYKKIADRISLQRCTDPAFQRLKSQLQHWFPPQG
ncbi:MAG: hypothetical protein GKR89_36680 [Candidatus Latescibacteria bacterium]|nr:hypothetical protein [Candidatus Latescibacterota bacterium]